MLFTRDYLHLKLFGIRIEADQLQTLNPVLILIMLPPITMMWHVLARFGWNLKPTSKMLIGFLVTGATMVVIAWSAFYGAGRVVAGAPAAVERAGKAAATISQLLPRNEAAERAAGKLIAAVTKSREAGAMAQTAETPTAIAAAEDANKAARAEMKAVAEEVKTTSPEIVAMICAKQAALEALRTAQVAFASASPGERRSIEETGKQIEAKAKAAQVAAEATNKAKDLALEAARDNEKELPAKTKDALTLCAVVATQAKGATSAAKSSIAALGADNDRAARINGAVAGVDAADAAVFAAQSAATFAGIEEKELPEVIRSTEDAAAASHISMLWQVIPYILMTVAEVCISVVGLELAFAAAPPAMKTFMTACWLMAVFVGNTFNGFITPLYNTTFLGFSLTPDWYFLWFTLAMIPVTLAFIAMSRRFNQPATAP